MLNILTVNGKRASQTRNQTQVNIASVTLDSTATQLEVVVTGFTDDVLSCTLVRFGRSDKAEPHESNWRTTRFVRNPSSSSPVTLDVPHPARYLLSCHSQADGSAYVEVINPPPPPPGGPVTLRNILALIDSNFTSTTITASGTVLNAGNPVRACSIRRVSCSSAA
jgi:hypothetical protein